MKISDPRWIIMALRNSFTWKGRARRAEVWWYLLLPTVLVGAFLAALLAGAPFQGDTFLTIYALVVFVVSIPGISGAIRRLHDLGRSGNWYLLLFATLPLGPIIGLMLDSTLAWTLSLLGAVILSYWFLQRGTIGDNRFGPDPLMED